MTDTLSPAAPSRSPATPAADLRQAESGGTSRPAYPPAASSIVPELPGVRWNGRCQPGLGKQVKRGRIFSTQVRGALADWIVACARAEERSAASFIAQILEEERRRRERAARRGGK